MPDPSPSKAGVGACWLELVSPWVDVIPKEWRETTEVFAITFGCSGRGLVVVSVDGGIRFPRGSHLRPDPKRSWLLLHNKSRAMEGRKGKRCLQGPVRSDSVLLELKIS